jgi:Ankyrin repeats (3 copies)
MSNQGRALISALNAGDFAAVDQYSDLSDLDIKIVNSHIHELFERAIKGENFKLFMAILKIPKVLVSGPEYCALRQAASLGHVEYVRELARIPSANANIAARNGDTALIAAIRGGWTQKKALDLVRAILILPKVKVNIRDNAGCTALWHALKKGWFDVANVLMDAGGNPLVEDEDGTAPLTLGITAVGLPGDLLGRLLGYSGSAEEDEAEQAHALPTVAADEDDSSHQSRRPDPFGQSIVHHPPVQRSPGISSNVVIKDDDDDTPPPPVRKVSTVVQDFTTDEPPMHVGTQAPVTKAVEDTADFFAVMEGQAIDDTLEKRYLFDASKDGRWRMHRKAVLEQVEYIMTTLSTTGEALTATDCARRDPASGLNLWQTAAIQGQFGLLLKAMARNNRWPEAADLLAKTEDGRSLTDYLDDNAQLNQVLNDPAWAARPKLLATLMSSLPERRLRAMSPLVAKTNLLILSGG